MIELVVGLHHIMFSVVYNIKQQQQRQALLLLEVRHQEDTAAIL
jgi:hypothetical protein